MEVVPAMDMRLAVLVIPARLSSPELAIDRFSSAELPIDARDRCDEVVVDVVGGLRAVEVVVGRVGGLFNVVELVVPRVVEDVVVFEAVDDVVGRLAVVVPDTARLVVVVELLTGECLAFSLEASGLDLAASGLDLATSGLEFTSSLPERTVDATGVAGGAFSTPASAAVGTESSADAILLCEYLIYAKRKATRLQYQDRPVPNLSVRLSLQKQSISIGAYNP